MLARLPQGVIWMSAVVGLAACWRLFPKGWRQLRLGLPPLLSLGIALAFALFCLCVFATNPDDTTFFHRVAFNISFGAPLPVNDTRLAFDDIPAISAAHLVPSWEYGLVLMGSLIGSPLAGYQLLGTGLAALTVAASIEYTQRRMFPDAPAFLGPAVLGLVLILLYFDADTNRRIGTWLIIGTWTGKCFLAALLLLLFPAWDAFTRQPSARSAAFLICLIVSLTGLTGSALFILPLGLGCAYLTSALFLRRDMPFIAAGVIAAIPLAVGAAFLFRFGNTPDTSYWQNIANHGFAEYVQLVLSPRNVLLYAAAGVTAAGWSLLRKQGSSFVIRFLSYQLLVAATVLNPLLLPVFFSLVPADGFWRAFYLFQYPAAYILFSGAVILALSRRQVWCAVLLAAAYIGFLASGKPLWQLQGEWNYPYTFMAPGTLKLDPAETRSIAASAEPCRLEEGGIILAPERWEVAAQMKYPRLTSVAARHMAHNFNNVAPAAELKLPEAERVAAAALVSGYPASIASLAPVVTLGVDVVVIAESAPPEIGALLVEDGFQSVSGSEGYTVYCKLNPLRD